MFRLKFLKAMFMLVVAFVTIGGTVTPALAGAIGRHKHVAMAHGSGSATGGKVISLRVTLWTEAPAGGAVVTLKSSSPVITVPATATIPAGSTQTVVKIKTMAVHENTPVMITATYKNRVRVKQILVLRPYLSSTTIQSRIRSGGLARFTVRLSGIAPDGGITVRFNSNRPSAVPVPATLYFPAGKASATYIATGAVVHKDVELNISAKYRGVTITKPTILRKARGIVENPGTGVGDDEGGNGGGVGDNPGDGGSDNGDGGNNGDNPGGDNPGGDNPGGDNPGGDNPGGDNPGGDNPGGDNPGGDNPGDNGDNPGGDTGNGDGNDQGDNQGGDDQGDNTGGDDQGDNQNGDGQGDNTGGDQNGGDQGGDTGNQDGGNDDGGSNGGDQGGDTGGDQGGDTGDNGGDTGGETGGDEGTVPAYICHMTGNDAYNQISPNVNGIINGHLTDDGGDIIPTFTYKGTTYEMNWPSGQAIWENGCAVPVPDNSGDQGSGNDEGAGDQNGTGGDNGQGGDEQTNPGGGDAGSGDTGSNDGGEVVPPADPALAICHAAGKSGKYVQNSPNVSGIVHGHMGHDGDIIPPFSYNGVDYAGQNWNPAGQAIYNNSCTVPAP